MAFKRFGAQLLFVTVVVALGLSVPSYASQSTSAADTKLSFQMAKLFFASRAAVGENPKFLEDPTAGHSKKELLDAIRTSYNRMANETLNEKGSPELGAMWKAVESVIDMAMKGDFKGRWKDHPNFPGKLIPARFGHEVTKAFNALAQTNGGRKLSMKWTTSDEYLVNPASKADDWERAAIQERFRSPGWKQGDPFSENTGAGFRYAMPEYFKSSCMNCHGGEMGQKIHSGKMVAGSGTFGGVLSVAWWKPDQAGAKAP